MSRTFEWINNFQRLLNHLSILHIFRIQNLALMLKCAGDNLAVVIGKLITFRYLDSSLYGFKKDNARCFLASSFETAYSNTLVSMKYLAGIGFIPVKFEMRKIYLILGKERLQIIVCSLFFTVTAQNDNFDFFAFVKRQGF